MKRLAVSAAIFSAFAMLTVGCGDKSNPTGPTATSIIGKWIFSRAVLHATMSGSGMSVTIDSTITFAGNNDYLDIKSDNTYTAASDGKHGVTTNPVLAKTTSAIPNESGTWSLSGNTLTLTATADTTAFSVSLNGSSGTFTMNINETMESVTIHGTCVYSAIKQ